MKIIFMIYDAPNYHGGPSTNARRLLPELQKRGHEVHCMFFFRGGDAPTARFLESQGIQCHLLSQPRHIEPQINWILKQLQKINPDVFCPNHVLSGWYAAKWVQQAGIPAIAVHRSNDSYYWGMVRKFVVGPPDWSVAGLVCVDNYIRNKVQSFQPKNTKLCVIPSGVPIPQKSSSQTDPLKIVYVGRLIQKQKRVIDTLEALIKVTNAFPDVKITFFGGGSERTYLEKRVKEANLSNTISFVGAVPNEDLHKQLVQHDVIVLLSDYEGTPGSLMDGMACGLVPVCSNISGGVQELVIPDQTGFLVNDRAENLLKAIRKLYGNPKLRTKLAKNSRQHIINEYSLLSTATRWENFCQLLIESAQPRSIIQIPLNYNLPPVIPEFDREDIRQQLLWKRIILRIRQLIRKH